ncbi:putative protein isoform X2 [Capsicum annuum]|uniref:uncharacterized protein LOC107858531 isoform X2 n=1 Tax=Capsicum annuum TaxID=4072 RepID=UPI001FB17E8A|nr:uncharacterized protein LOC107858531 isoform X2 [Capsicum annuum]
MLKTFIREIGSLSNFSLFTCSSSVARESLASELRFAAQQKLKDCPSPSNLKKKIDRIESQRKRKSMSESLSHKKTRSKSRRLLGADKDEKKISQQERRRSMNMYLLVRRKKRNEIGKKMVKMPVHL